MKDDEIQIEMIAEKISDDHQSSFWYEGDIAKLTYKDRIILVVACGDIAIHKASTDELVHDGYKERNDGITLENDHDLTKVGYDEEQKYYWENNNFFDYLYTKKDREKWTDCLGDVEFEFDRAIERAKEILKDDKFWEKI